MSAELRPYRPCMDCTHSTVYDYDRLMVRCELSGKTGEATACDCLSQRRRKPLRVSELARGKLRLV